MWWIELTAVDTAESLFAVVHLVDPGSSRSEMLRCELNSERPEIEKHHVVVPGSRLARTRDSAEMFGIEFLGRSQTNALLMRGDGSSPSAQDRSRLMRGEDPVAWQESTTGRRRRETSRECGPNGHAMSDATLNGT